MVPRNTLLVIDDEPNILTTVRRALEIEGYAVEVAGSGALGLSKLDELEIDLVLLDVNMPGEGGLETLPKIRAKHPEVHFSLLDSLLGHEQPGEREKLLAPSVKRECSGEAPKPTVDA